MAAMKGFSLFFHHEFISAQDIAIFDWIWSHLQNVV